MENKKNNILNTKEIITNQDNSNDKNNLLGAKREREEDPDDVIHKLKFDPNNEKSLENPQAGISGAVQNLVHTAPQANNYANYNIMSAIPQNGNYGYYNTTPLNYYPQQNIQQNLHSKIII